MKHGAPSRRRGSVMMEYVIVNTAIAIPIVLTWRELLYNGVNWIKLGEDLQTMYCELFRSIMLPFP